MEATNAHGTWYMVHGALPKICHGTYETQAWRVRACAYTDTCNPECPHSYNTYRTSAHATPAHTGAWRWGGALPACMRSAPAAAAVATADALVVAAADPAADVPPVQVRECACVRVRM